VYPILKNLASMCINNKGKVVELMRNEKLREEGWNEILEYLCDSGENCKENPE